MKSGEGLVGVLEVESGERCLGVVEYVKVSQFLLLLSLSGYTCESIKRARQSVNKRHFSYLLKPKQKRGSNFWPDVSPSVPRNLKYSCSRCKEILI